MGTRIHIHVKDGYTLTEDEDLLVEFVNGKRMTDLFKSAVLDFGHDYGGGVLSAPEEIRRGMIAVWKSILLPAMQAALTVDKTFLGKVDYITWG